MQGLITKYSHIRFENYDVRYCKEAMLNADIRGGPAYHLKSANASETLYGADSELLERKLCDVLGECP